MTTPLVILQTGGTVVGGNPGTMVVRVVQNDQGSSLPPDLVDAAPRFSPKAQPGELVTLVDIGRNALRGTPLACAVRPAGGSARTRASGWPTCSERPRTPSGSRGRRRR